MTLLEAISTGRLYSRTGGVWLKSERVNWPIRHTLSGAPAALSEADIKADDWVIDIRTRNHGHGVGSWMYSFDEWENYKKSNK